MTRLVYEADPAAYLERARRIREHYARLTSGESIDVEAWSTAMRGFLREVEPLALVLGVRYRVRVLGTQPQLEHRHFEDEAGSIHGLDMISMENLEFVELEGVYRGRGPEGPWKGLLMFDVAGKVAPLADVDILRLEEQAA